MERQRGEDKDTEKHGGRMKKYKRQLKKRKEHIRGGKGGGQRKLMNSTE